MAHELPTIPLPPDWYWYIDGTEEYDLKIFATNNKLSMFRTVAQRYPNGCWVAAHFNSVDDRLNDGSAWAPDVHCADREEALALAASYAWLNLQGE